MGNQPCHYEVDGYARHGVLAGLTCGSHVPCFNSSVALVTLTAICIIVLIIELRCTLQIWALQNCHTRLACGVGDVIPALQGYDLVSATMLSPDLSPCPKLTVHILLRIAWIMLQAAVQDCAVQRFAGDPQGIRRRQQEGFCHILSKPSPILSHIASSARLLSEQTITAVQHPGAAASAAQRQLSTPAKSRNQPCGCPLLWSSRNLRTLSRRTCPAARLLGRPEHQPLLQVLLWPPIMLGIPLTPAQCSYESSSSLRAHGGRVA